MKNSRNLREERRKLRVGEVGELDGLDNLNQENIDRILVEQIYAPARIRAKGWNFTSAVIEAHKQFFDKLKNQKHLYPREQFEGKGIVTLGGGKYFTCTYILIRLLRELGCMLPIEWWYLDDSELDPRAKDLLADYNVTFRCAEDEITEHPRCFGGWQAKIWAITYSKFQEVLFLDGDQLPVKNPEYLFEWAGYVETGAIFWQDYKNHLGLDIDETAFRVLGVPAPGYTTDKWKHGKPTDYEPFESGQILLNKEKQWDTIQLCKLLNDHSDFFYPDPKGHQQWHIYGDKSTFRLAWMAHGDNCKIMSMPTWGGVKGNGAFMQPDFSGNVIFQHKCQPPEKYRFNRKYPHAPGLVHQEKVDRYIDELKANWDGKIWGNLEVDKNLVGIYKDEDENRITLGQGGAAIKNTEIDQRGGSWGLSNNFVVVSIKGERTRIYDQGRDGTLIRNLRNGSIRYLVPNILNSFIIPPGDKFAAGAWAAINISNEYRLPDVLPENAEIVDIGGHIGAFAVTCLLRGAKHVVSFEPDPDNFEYLNRNLSKYGARANYYNLAISGSGELTSIGFGRPEGAKHSGGGSITDISESEVTKKILVCGWENLSNLIPDQIFLLKLDCEGAEWPILLNCEFQVSKVVQNICGEYHLAHNSHTVDDLKKALEIHGFQYHIQETLPTLGLFWGWKKESPFVFA